MNNTVAEVLTHLQDNYIQLMPHELLVQKYIIKKMTYHPQELIAIIFSSIKELLELSNINRNLYTQLQSVNISDVILHRTGKFGLAIHKSNGTTTVQKVWVRF